MKSFVLRASLLIVAACGAPSPAAPLTADQIVLVVNRAVPQSIELAQFYATSRNIPLDRIIALDLPTTEEMPFDRYERAVTPVVRQYLKSRGLDKSVRCLVTFLGVPLRISDRINSQSDTVEQARLRENLRQIMPKIEPLATEMEAQVLLWDASFKPASNEKTLEAYGQRITAAIQSLATAAQRAKDPEIRQKIVDFVTAMGTRMTAPVELNNVPPTTAPGKVDINDLAERPYDPAARQALREATRKTGIFKYARILEIQIDYLSTDATGAAFDNELALTLWTGYSRTRWQLNPLNAHYRGLNAPTTLMVMRLDAPTPQLVRDIITNSLAVEKEGLHGRMVIDSRGLSPRDSKGQEDNFGIFDQRFRDLNTLLKEKSSMPVMLDDRPDVIGPNSVDDVALYCGWYSLRNYVPGMKFNRGAVGYHVASFELVGLHGEHENGWVHGLIKSGVVGTLGPVAEPYLHSFPPPDEFFPLLLTGKMTLAEVYWTTCPLISWMQSCIGDPLYNPFAKDPKFKVEDLPGFQQAVLNEGNIIQGRGPNGR